MNRTILNISLFLAALFLSNFSLFGQNLETAFIGVKVISPETGKISEKQTVIIKEGKIAEIGSCKLVKPSKNALKIKGKGRYLMPGISEMHAHIPVAQDGDDSKVKDVLFLYLSNGITTIRGMLGNTYHLKLIEQAQKGEILSPRIYTSAPSLNGNSVQSKEEARQKVTQYKNDGYHFLKMHPGLSLENFNEIVKTANEVGIGFAGHISTAVGIRHSIDSKYASIDHLDGYVEGLVPKSAGVHPDSNGFFGINFTDKVDMSLLPDLVQKTKENDVWLVPTHCLMPHIVGPIDVNYLSGLPEMKYVPSNTRFQWRQVKSQVVNDPNYDSKIAGEFLEIRDKILKAMHDGGVGILLGSDAPQIFNVPGFSIQHEMKAMVNAGLTPLDVIRTGTLNPAQFFNEENTFGKIQKGHSADLILLEENPLIDISNMSKIEGVMVRGKWLSKEKIEEKLEAIAKKYE